MTLVIDQSFKSPNFNSRPAGIRPSAIVLHTSEGNWDSDRAWLCSSASQVSAHYIISPTGELFQLVPDAARAWHAGVGTFAGIADWNDVSIGIEVSHREGHAWLPGQREVLRELCLMLIAKYGIVQSRIAAHRWIAPDRRRDPTDFPDPELHAWIAQLYGGLPPAPDFAAAWGTAFTYFADSGIAASWRTKYQQLGMATTDEMNVGTFVARAFEHGLVVYDPKTGRAQPVVMK